MPRSARFGPRTALVAIVAGLALTGLLTAACSGGSGGSVDEPGTTSAPPPLEVVVTTPILGDVVAAVAGDRAHVTVLMHRTDDPRAFTLPAGDDQVLAAADLVVAVDPATYEVGLAAPIAAATSSSADGNPAPELVVAVDVLDARRVDGTPDPHVWLDADRFTTLAREVARAMAARSLTDPAPWQAAAEDYGHQLALADEQVQATLAPLTPGQRRLVVTDQRLGYTADRYDLELVPLDAGADPGQVLAIDVDRLGPPGTPTGTVAGLLVSIATQIATA